MKITIITSNSIRHKFLIKSLSHHKLKIIIEKKKKFNYLKNSKNASNVIIKKYFKKVIEAEKKIFKNIKITKQMYDNKIEFNYGTLTKKKIFDLKKYLDSDLFIVYGSSYIKGELAKYLYKKKSINIHMGISPYYKGTNCNFWASIDKNFHLIGATIHLLSKNIDGGPILYHSISKRIANPYYYSMKNVKSAILSLRHKIDNKTLFKIKPLKQEIDKNIRYTKNKDLEVKHFKKYPKKVTNFKFKKKLLINPIMTI